ncbi:hypothetical protein PENTCL1PPCAC_21890, partial [Pristionchus entomophagus]
RLATLIFLLLAERIAANPELENGVIGQPEVRCGPNSITVLTHTAAPFAGRLYVQGEAETEGCVSRPKGATDYVEFELRFGECGMRRQRTLSPRGVTYSFTLVVSFHPVFVTGTDRSFNVRCFFLESVKSLEAEVDTSPTGPPVKYARVGDAVAHVWNCGEEAAPAYGMLIHSCYVDDGAGKRFELIDDRGCGVDRVLLPQIEYDRENLVASAKSSIFKYADKIQVFFTCTVQLCFKKDGGCDELTPPLCDGNPHPPHPDHPVLLIPEHEDHHHQHPEEHHHDRPPPPAHGPPEGHRGPPLEDGPNHRPHDEDEEEEEGERRPRPRFIPRGGPRNSDSREHRGPPPPYFPPRHRGPSRERGGEERDGSREHGGPPHRPREDRPDSSKNHGPPRGDRDGPRGRFGPPRGGPRDEEDGERPPPPPRGLFPTDGLPDEIKNSFESKFAPPSKEFFGPMDRDSDLRLDSPLHRDGSSAEGEKLLGLKSNSTIERKRPDVRVFSGNSVSSSSANSLDAALQAVDREEYSDDLDDIEALLNASSDATSEPLRYRTDFASSTLSPLELQDDASSTTTPSTSSTSTSSETPSTTTSEEEEPLIRVSTMSPILKDAPPPSSTQYPFSSTGTIFDPDFAEKKDETEKKQVGWENDRTSRNSEARKKLETDLSVDVIVLPFEEDKPSTPSTLHSPPSLPSIRPVLCLSAIGSSLLLSAVLLGLLVVAAVSFTLARRGRGSGRGGPEPVASKRLDLF